LFDGILGKGEGVGDLKDGLLPAIEEHQRFPIVVRNATQGAPEKGLLFVADRAFRGSGCGIGEVGRSRSERLTGVAAARVLDEIPRDAAEP
jgi:hypothetical protein